MFYRCKDCGGNAVYDPKKKKMLCESCGNKETQEKIPQEKLHICNNCGAEIESKKTDLALKCPYCGTYVIFEDRMEDEYKPDLALPFVIDRKEAIEIIRKNFAKKMFIPKDFCSIMRITNLAGIKPMETGSFMWMTGKRDTPGCVQLVLQKRDSMIRTQNRLWIVPTKS